MNAYKSGLTYEKLRKAATSGALETLGSGSYRKNGKSYQAKVSYLDRSGAKPVRVYLTKTLEGTSTKPTNNGGTGKKALESMVIEWVQAVRADIEEVGFLNKDPSRSTIECVYSLIKSKEVRNDDGELVDIRESTLAFYRSCAVRIARCPIGSKPLNELTDMDVKAWVNGMAAGTGIPKPLSRKSIKDSLNLLSQVCREYKLRVNPCDGVKIPKNAKVGKSDMYGWHLPNHLNTGGVARLNKLLDEREKRHGYADAVVVGARIALLTGVRCEEVCGLRWRDVDMLNKKIHIGNVIERAAIPCTDENGKQMTKYVAFDAKPKTAGSVRDIPMNDVLACVLENQHRYATEICKAEHPRMGNASIEKMLRDEYVVSEVNADGERSFVNPHKLGIRFKRWATRNNVLSTDGVVVGMHDLRHSWATLTIQRGLPIPDVSRMLGHSSIKTTLDKYVGTDEAAQRKVMESAGEIFGARTPDDIVMLPTGTET